MKLTTSLVLMVFLFSSCEKQEDKNQENLYADWKIKNRSGLVLNKFNGTLYSYQGNDLPSLSSDCVLHGLRDGKLWVGVFDENKEQIFEWTHTKGIDTIIRQDMGFGEFQDIALKYEAPNNAPSSQFSVMRCDVSQRGDSYIINMGTNENYGTRRCVYNFTYVIHNNKLVDYRFCPGPNNYCYPALSGYFIGEVDQAYYSIDEVYYHSYTNNSDKFRVYNTANWSFYYGRSDSVIHEFIDETVWVSIEPFSSSIIKFRYTLGDLSSKNRPKFIDIDTELSSDDFKWTISKTSSSNSENLYLCELVLYNGDKYKIIFKLSKIDYTMTIKSCEKIN